MAAAVAVMAAVAMAEAGETDIAVTAGVEVVGGGGGEWRRTSPAVWSQKQHFPA